MSAESATSFDTVTELPGNLAHRDQVDAMRTRYEWAAGFCSGNEVVEIACGAGIGLGVLARNAKFVTGGDVDPVVLKFGKEHYVNRNIRVMELDACKMDLPENSVDVASCFEATYYFPSVAHFLEEVTRILRSSGVFLCSSVNCQWHGFNPSPHSRRYHSVSEMRLELENAGFMADFFVAFEDNPASYKRRLIALIRRMAVQLGLVPKTMKRKEFFKKLFYGKLTPLPAEMTSAHGIMHRLIRLDDSVDLANYKFYYFAARPK